MATAVKQVSALAVRGGSHHTAWKIEDHAKLRDGPIDARKQGSVIRRGPVVKARLECGAPANGGGQQ